MKGNKNALKENKTIEKRMKFYTKISILQQKMIHLLETKIFHMFYFYVQILLHNKARFWGEGEYSIDWLL